MTGTIFLHLAVEDALSEETLRKLLAVSGRDFAVCHCYQRGGFGYLKKQSAGFNRAARITPFLLLTDLDQEACPASLISAWLPDALHSNFLFRIAIRTVESWLLADRHGIASFLAISQEIVPRYPDSLSDPKRALIAIANQSRRRALKEAIVPAPKSSAKQGPDYNGCLVRFVSEHWNPGIAKNSSGSLRRTIDRLKDFQPI